jgi:hypothetical protein
MATNKACGAKTRSGAPCKNRPCVGRERCKMHGGMSARAGPTHPSWKHGRRSKVFEARYSGALDGLVIREAYERARTDPKLLQLTEDIALLVAKQQDTLEGLRTGESTAAWDALAVLLAQAQRAVAAGDDLAPVLDQMADVVANGVGDAAVWAEYTERAERIRRLVDTQRKYEEGLRLYLPLDQAQALFALWQDAIRRAVPREYIARIYEELQKSRPGKTAASLH